MVLSIVLEVKRFIQAELDIWKARKQQEATRDPREEQSECYLHIT